MATLVGADDIRTKFSRAMSAMYQAEVPQYAELLAIVAEVNREVLLRDPALSSRLEAAGETQRLSVERHGAIRLGTAAELKQIARLFAVMGMEPVGYYDLSVAGVPVHSTAFRPIDDAALKRNPFRIFTSLLRLELIDDENLRTEAARILATRKIVTERASELAWIFLGDGGLSEAQAEEFVREALETFRWHKDAMVDAGTYARLSEAHPLIADVVSFKGPHINHLTPRTLDIDLAQERMRQRRLTPKAVIEGPPRRNCPILLRQTSFLAIEEPIVFRYAERDAVAGRHKARFGEIEQRGAALTRKGRQIYDDWLATKEETSFEALPDDWSALRGENLAYFHYRAGDQSPGGGSELPLSISSLIERRYLRFDPINYEDFLPVSAAGIFRSNLGDDAREGYTSASSRASFEDALGRPTLDEFELYARAEKTSLQTALSQLGVREAELAEAMDGKGKT
ncbi:2-oxoadipate dioxygenase/decarboxylase HglS [Rhodoblastus sp.]|uniref:2-oxoadipate dioxygenase/decarboxylase HglS n=1 Tax=Rhodoblastus sp. TaxID=1962975 RepID=UPI003F9B94CD